MKKVCNIKITLDENEIKQLISDYLGDREDTVPYDVTIESSQIQLHYLDGKFSAEFNTDVLENLEP